MLAPLGVPREEALEVLSLGGLGLRRGGLRFLDRLEELVDAGELPRKLHALSEAASQGGWWQGICAAYRDFTNHLFDLAIIIDFVLSNAQIAGI